MARRLRSSIRGLEFETVHETCMVFVGTSENGARAPGGREAPASADADDALGPEAEALSEAHRRSLGAR